MYSFSIIYFFVITLITGTFIDLFVLDWKAEWLEKLIMRIGVGLAAMSVIGIILNLLHIPLDYRVFLGAGFLIFMGAIIRNKQFRTIETGKMWHALTQCWKKKTFWYGLFMLVLFGITVNMYESGTFAYDYLEDTDPWRYTVVADYIGENKTFTVPYYSIQYSEPYTQGYQIVMGVLSQTNDSIYWTMKFFHSFIISFSVLFMYYFVRRYSRNEEIAVLAGFFLFAVPAWVTHFVFSLHYNMTIFVVLLYVLAQLMYEGQEFATLPVTSSAAKKETPGILKSTNKQENKTTLLQYGLHHLSRIKGWMYVAIVVYASMLINHFSTVIHGSIFCFVFIVTRILAERKIDWKTIMVFPGGFLLSLLFFIPAFARHWWLTETKNNILGGMRALFPLMRFLASPFGIVLVVIALFLIVIIYRSRIYWQKSLEEWLDVGNRGMAIWLGSFALVLIVLLLPFKIAYQLGTDDRLFSSYTLANFFLASAQNRYHNPVGLGFVLMSAVIASFLLASAQIKKLFKPDNAWIAVIYAWIITAFLLVIGEHFSIAIIPFRAWTFLGLFASLFAAWGIVTLIQYITKNYWILFGAIVMLTAVVTPTSFMPKHELNTKIWRDFKIGTPESQSLFSWMRNGGIPKNSVVAHLCGTSEFLSAYDMNPPVWNLAFRPQYRAEGATYFSVHPLYITPEAYTILKNAKVEYVTVGKSCYWQDRNKKTYFNTHLQKAVKGYLTDSRLTLIKNTKHELLFKLN
jgi:hypothetical protein